MSSRMRAPCSNTRASTNSSSTAIHGVGDVCAGDADDHDRAHEGRLGAPEVLEESEAAGSLHSPVAFF
jgi:hypothetical protein